MRLGVALASALVALAIPLSAQAQAPDNLVQNGDEGPLSSPSGYDYLPVGWPFWRKLPEDSGAIPVRYGAPAFPSKELSARIGGGLSFFAGGPSRPGDDNTSAKYVDPIVYQVINFDDAALQLIRAGNQQITVTGCLGGYADQNDWVSIDGVPRLYGQDRYPREISVTGPQAAERGNKTDLLPRSGTMDVPIDATVFTVGVHFHRTSGIDTYNDGYVDKIGAYLSPSGSDPPKPDCEAPKQTPPPGKKDPTPKDPTPKDPDDGSNTTVPLTRSGKRVSFGKRYATFKLHCIARDSGCRGSVTLKTKTSKVGSARFKIATGKTGTVKVKLGRKWRARVAHLSKRRFARLKLTAVVKIGAEKTSFSFGALR